jgi:hypothetical protein
MALKPAWDDWCDDDSVYVFASDRLTGFPYYSLDVLRPKNGGLC